MLMAAHNPVMVARDRVLGARAIADGPRSANVIVMDDGLQNPHLAKDLTFAIVDGARGFGNGLVMPSGPLRAPLAAQFSKVDAIIINHAVAEMTSSHVAAQLRQTFTGPVLDASITQSSGDTWDGKTVVAFAGIGVPERFFSHLEKLGAVVAERVPYPDHHRYSDADADTLLSLARRHAATLVTTAKDKVRLMGHGGQLDELDRSTSVLSIRMTLADRDQLRLDALLDGVFSRRPVPAISAY
jgi:tetraacyldisaccharide 4'-kinase